MLIHVVSFKYKPETPATARQDHVAALEGLKTLPGVLELAVGADVVQSPRSYDTGLLVKFANRHALDAYAVHPEHVPVAELGRALASHIVAVDFEV